MTFSFLNVKAPQLLLHLSHNNYLKLVELDEKIEFNK